MTKYLYRMALLSLAHAALSKLALDHFSANHVGLFWPAAGLALAALLIGGIRYWPATFFGSMISLTLNGDATLTALALACSNTLGPVIAFWLISAMKGLDLSLSDSRDYISVIAGGALGFVVPSATGAIFLWFAGTIHGGEVWPALLNWWRGDTLGVIILTPLLLVWRTPPKGWLAPGKLAETVFFIGLTLLASELIFMDWSLKFLKYEGLGYWFFPLVCWAAVRFSHHGVLLIVAVVSVQGLHGAIDGKGVFAHDLEQTGLLSFWLYIFSLVTVGKILSSYVKKLRRSEEHLRLSQTGGGIGAWEHDLKSDTETWTELTFKLLGLPPTDHPSYEDFLARVHPEDRLNVSKAFVALKDRGEAYDIEFRCFQANGEIHWLHTTGKLQADENNRPRYIRGVIQDVTEKRQLIDTFLDSQLRYRTMIDQASPDAIYVFDHSGRFLDVNRQACSVMGYSREELMDICAFDLEQDYDRTEAQEALIRMTPGSTITIRGRHLRKDGTSFPVELRFGLQEKDGERIYICFARDITERIQAENEVGKLFQAIEQSPESILITDTEGNIEYVNQTYLKRTGYAPEEVIGFPVSNFKSGKNTPETYAELWATLKQNAVWKGQLVNRRKDGSEYIDFIIISPLYNTKGEVTHYFSVQEDVTEKIRISKELDQYRESLESLLEERNKELVAAMQKIQVNEERLSYALEATSDGIWDWDIPSGKAFINSAYHRMLGYDPGELGDDVQRHFIDLLHPEDRDRIVSSANTLLENDGAYALEFRMRCKDGSYKWILSRGMTVSRDRHGRPLRAIGTHIDLTDRKQIEADMIKARQNAEDASHAKSAFLANMSHEIRTPLNAIIGFSELMRKQIDQPDQADRLDKILDAGRHLLGVINDILDYSKIDAAQVCLEQTAFAIPTLIDQTRNMLGAAAHAKGLKFITTVDPGLSKLVLVGDQLRLGQVLINLTNNAIKFTERGHVAILATVESEQDDRLMVRFEVQDTGIGISNEQQSHIFQAFEQAEASTTRKYGGTGLGLAIAKRLATLMGGDAGVNSRPGQGSTFWFTANLQRGQPENLKLLQDKVPAHRGITKGCRILLTEDNEINQEVACELLKDLGLVIDIAENGQEALDKLPSGSYDLILMDMQMPVMDGLEATRRIRSMPSDRERQIPIIAMTANAFEEDRRRCMEAGMNDFLAKPITPSLLAETLAKWLPASHAEPSGETQPLTAADQAVGHGRSVSHVNQTKGLEYFGNKIVSYHRVLGRFVTLNANKAETIAESLSSGDRSLAERLAHSLKGTSASLGIDDLHKLAFSIEQKIRHGCGEDELKEDIAQLQSMLGEVCEEIGELLSAS